MTQLFVGQSSCSLVWQHQQCAKAFLCPLPPVYRGLGLRWCCRQLGCKERWKAACYHLGFPSAMCCILVVCLARNVNSSCLFASSLRNCCQLPSQCSLQPCVWSPFCSVFLFQTSGCFHGTGLTLYPPCLLTPAAFQYMARRPLLRSHQISWN